MTERGMQVKSDIHKAGWEGSEFPILCETCLGENPYVRMTRTKHGDECKICERPFTIFRWKPGPRARFKKTQCCQTCARQKNVCQTCILDLTYGLPVKVRDTYLSKQAKAANQLQVAKSFVGREYQAQNAALQQGPNAYQSANLHQGLVRLARSQPNYRRNLPIVCTFFSRGECNRGNECPYRHEMPTARDHPMYTQNIKDRFYGTDDPVANAMLKGASKAGVYVDPPTSTVRTLWMSPVDEKMTDKDLRDKLYAYGEITSIKLKPDRGCAFVEFSTQAQAVAAYKAVYSSLKINDVLLRVSWARERRGGGDVYGAFLDYTYRQLSKDAAKGGQQQPAGGQGSAAAAGAGAGAGAASGGGAAKASSGASASTGAATTTTSTAATTASASSASSSTAAAAAGATTTAAPASAPAAPASGGFGGFGGYSYQFPAYMPPPPGYSPGMQLPAYMGGAAATAGYGGYGGYAPPPGPPGARTGGSGPMRHARNAPRHHPYMYPSMNPASMGAKSSRKK